MKNEKKLFWFFIYIFIFGCSFGAGSWNDLSEEIKRAKDKNNSKIIFSTKKKFNQEIENNKEIILNKPFLNINWTDLVPCQGSMTFSVGDAEFTDRNEMEKWYDQSIDTRANHMLQINHSVFADKLYRRFTKNEIVNLETEFKTGFLRHTDKLTHPGLCDELIEMAKAPGYTIPK